MATLTQHLYSPPHIRPWVFGWFTAAGVLAALLALLTTNVTSNQLLVQDQTVLDWVAGWDFPGLGGLFGTISTLTGAKAGIVYGAVGIIVLLLLGKTRQAAVFGTVGLTIGAIAIMGDYTLGQIVDRGRPLAGPNDSFAAFPSGHVFGSTVFFGFIAFLAVHYQLKKNLLVALMLVLGALLLFVGPARVFEQAHWPTDVAAGYLLGGLWLLVIIPAFVFIRRTRWMISPRSRAAQWADECSNCEIASSIASVVVLNPEQGTGTKVYKPPTVVRLLYWLAFQAKFPYETNAAAL